MGRLCGCMSQQVCRNIHPDDLRLDTLCQRPRKAPCPASKIEHPLPGGKTCELDKLRRPQVQKLWAKAVIKFDGIVCGRLRPVSLHETPRFWGPHIIVPMHPSRRFAPCMCRKVLVLAWSFLKEVVAEVL